ncbi:MAG: hypothetical protein NTV34_17460 [Proteobacteria bacterium]|nr:hypothetical protein [Pseudomonadota bacterium]
MEHEIDLLHGIIIPYVNFIIFISVLVYFFRKPLTAMAELRRDKFLQSSKDAAAALQQAQQGLLQKKFNLIDQELTDFKKQSQALAEEEAQRILHEGEKLATQIAAETKRVAVEEVARAKHAFREELVSAARVVAEQKIAEKLTDAEKARILSVRMSDLNTIHL